MEYLIIASRKDPAGMNIVNHLKDLGSFNIYICDEEIIYTENIDLNKINKYDFIIFASMHKSSSEEKTLSVHSIGNWRNADFGGENKKISPTSALFFKQIFQELDKQAKVSNLTGYSITMEATHHGPLISKPSVFIEIGPSLREWQDSRAGFVVAKTIREIIEKFKHNKYNEIAIAIGGPHYCPSFNKIQLSSNVAISHIIASYALPVDETMILEAIKKTTEEEVDYALLDWKGIGNSFARDQLISVLDKLKIRYVKVSEVGKNE